MATDSHRSSDDSTRLIGALVWGVATAFLGSIVAAIAGASWWGVAAVYVLGGVAGMLATAVHALARSRPATGGSDLDLSRDAQRRPT